MIPYRNLSTHARDFGKENEMDVKIYVMELMKIVKA